MPESLTRERVEGERVRDGHAGPRVTATSQDGRAGIEQRSAQFTKLLSLGGISRAQPGHAPGPEAPRGQLGYYIVADGTGVNPYRVKVKSPCFTAMSVFHVLAKGMYIADIIALIGSLDVVLGEIVESIECLSGGGPEDLRELVLLQGGEMLRLTGNAATLD